MKNKHDINTDKYKVRKVKILKQALASVKIVIRC